MHREDLTPFWQPLIEWELDLQWIIAYIEPQSNAERRTG